MNEILGSLFIALLVVAYAICARRLGRELQALYEDMAGGEAGLWQDEDLDAELIARDLYLRHLEDLGPMDFGAIAELGS